MRSRMRTSASASPDPVRENIHVLHMIGPDRDVMAVEFSETVERPQRIGIVVEDRDAMGEPSIGLPQTGRRQFDEMPVGIAEIEAPATARPVGATFNHHVMRGEMGLP